MVNGIIRFLFGFLTLIFCTIFFPCGPLLLDCTAAMQTTSATRSRIVLPETPGDSEVKANPSQQDTDRGPESQDQWDRRLALSKEWRLFVFPGEVLYPIYIADPRRATNSISRMYFSETEIDEAGDDRYDIRLGGRFGVLRLYKTGDPRHGFELDFEAGFMGQFDLDHGTDNIGWDGIYGFHLAYAFTGGFAIRTGVMHDSSHVGDEHAERTGRQRVNYTREEVLVGLSWAFTEKWRAYLEGAYAHVLRTKEIMEPWRVEYGLEYVSPNSFWKGRFGWYAAVDVSSFEENDWDQNVTLQLGLLLRAKGIVRDYRLAVEYYNGRSQMGEFFQDEETYVAFGFWIDI